MIDMDPSLLPALHDALVVAQTSSIAEAAKRLHKTPSAVSQQLRRIEERWGVTLFERVGRGIRPSAAGEAALGALTRVFDEASSLSTLLGELAGSRVTTLRVASSDYLGEALLIPVMKWMAREAIPLQFDITTTHSTEAARLVEQGQVDVAIGSSDREPSADELTLFRQPFQWIAPRRATRRPRAIVSRLDREPALRLSPGSFGRRMFDELLGRLGLRPVSTIDLPSVSLMVSYVNQGIGVALAPGLAAARADRARVELEPADVPALDVRLRLRASLKRTTPVQRFLDRLIAEGKRAGDRWAR